MSQNLEVETDVAGARMQFYPQTWRRERKSAEQLLCDTHVALAMTRARLFWAATFLCLPLVACLGAFGYFECIFRTQCLRPLQEVAHETGSIVGMEEKIEDALSFIQERRVIYSSKPPSTGFPGSESIQSWHNRVASALNIATKAESEASRGLLASSAERDAIESIRRELTGTPILGVGEVRYPQLFSLYPYNIDALAAFLITLFLALIGLLLHPWPREFGAWIARVLGRIFFSANREET